MMRTLFLKITKSRAALFALMVGIYSLTLTSPPAVAAPRHASGSSFMVSKHGFHAPRDRVRLRYAAPRHHYSSHRVRYHNHRNWVWHPLAVGTAVAGTTWLLNNQYNPAPLVQNVIVAPQSSVHQITGNNTVFWCEYEQGYYPDVRACPTGWIAIPATK